VIEQRRRPRQRFLTGSTDGDTCSYVVYFERLKDEIRAGRSVRASVERGFRSAYRTILSADAVSFIGALVLWILSVGDVKGFAFMLGISTLTDVATAWFFTRPLVILLGRSARFTEARWFGVARGLARDPQRGQTAPQATSPHALTSRASPATDLYCDAGTRPSSRYWRPDPPRRAERSRGHPRPREA
jgi:MMPL family